jgi:hypothetical protein
MLSYPLQSFIAIIIISLVHLFANKACNLPASLHMRLLSIGSGMAIAYVFLDILPKLSKHEPLINNAIWQFFPYFERHVYVMALLGFLLFYVVDRSNKFFSHQPISFYFSLSSYAFLNLLIGYAVVDKDNPEVQPLVLFTVALALHYFAVDFSLAETFKKNYNNIARYILIICLFVGWISGYVFELSAAAVALVSAFIAGGVIMNVMRHELTLEHPTSLPSFIIATGSYGLILLLIG